MSGKAREVSISEGRELAARYPMELGPLCDDEARKGRRVYRCTRLARHAGPHVAHAPDGVVAIWNPAEVAR